MNRLKGQRLDIACQKAKKDWEDFLAKSGDQADFLRQLFKNRLKPNAAAPPATE